MDWINIKVLGSWAGVIGWVCLFHVGLAESGIVKEGVARHLADLEGYCLIPLNCARKQNCHSKHGSCLFPGIEWRNEYP